MKSISTFLLTLLIGTLLSSQSFSQCTTCDKYLDVIYDKISLSKTQDISASFASWFFDDNFEKEVRNNADGFSITVPFEGVPFTFGGSHETNDVWEKRRINKGSTKWDFSKISKSSLFTQIATDDARKTWLQCIKYSCSNELFPFEVVSNQSEAIITFKYNANFLSSAPTYQEFVCSSGLDGTEANRKFKNKPMKKLGEAVKFKWLNDDATEATIILNTSKGSSFPIEVQRNGKSNEVNLSYIINTLGPEKKIGEATSPRTSCYGSGGDQDSHCTTRSPGDGKYCAVLTTVRFNAGPGQIFRNARPRIVTGIGWNEAWVDIISTDQGDGTYASCVVRNWAHGAFAEITVDVLNASIENKIVDLKFPINSKKFSVTVPKGAMFPMITLKTANRWLYVRPDALISDDVKLIAVNSNELETKYDLEMK
nr:hypothetical protein [Mucilaginibacter sp. L294]